MARGNSHECQEETRSPVLISELRSAEWRVLRDVRLRALTDSPEAFLANGEVDELSKEDWQDTFTTGRWVVAATDRGIVGLARMLDDGVEAPHIESVWTDPGYRGRGIASTLIRWLVAKQQELGASEVLLWVLRSNQQARRLYEFLGFRPTGERQPVDGERIEERLRLPVD